MNRFLTIGRLGILFGVLFVVALGGVFAYSHFVTGPIEKCNRTGQWWYAEEKRCVTPVYIPDITRRAPGESRADASAARNREVVKLEREIAADKRARQQETDRQRAALRKAQGN